MSPFFYIAHYSHYSVKANSAKSPNGGQLPAAATDYWTLLDSLDLPFTYKRKSLTYSLETHGSHQVNGVELIPGAPGYDPQFAYGQWVSLLSPSTPPPFPTLSVAGSAAGLTVTLNVAGAVAMSVSGSLGNFATGSTVLSEQGTLKEGYLTLTANGNTSTATSQYVVLGTNGGDTVDYSANASRVDYIFGGAGADTLLGGAGDDVIHGGSGNDTITGGAGIDTLYGGDGDDKFRYLQTGDLRSGTGVIDSVDGGAGPNALVVGNNIGTQSAFQIYDTMSWARISNVSRIEAVGAFLAQFNLDLSDDAYEAGLRVIDLSADTDGSINANFIDVSAETGTANGYTLTGSVGIDYITGGAGADTLSGGSGNDVIRGGSGADSLTGGFGNDIFDFSVVSDWNSGKTITDFATTSVNNNVFVNQALNLNGDALRFDLSNLQAITGYVALTTTAPTGSNVSSLVAGDFVLIDNRNDLEHDLPIAATAAHAQFIYDNWTKAVYFDADGTGGAASATIIVGNITYTGLSSGMVFLVA